MPIRVGGCLGSLEAAAVEAVNVQVKRPPQSFSPILNSVFQLDAPNAPNWPSPPPSSLMPFVDDHNSVDRSAKYLGA